MLIGCASYYESSTVHRRLIPSSCSLVGHGNRLSNVAICKSLEVICPAKSNRVRSVAASKLVCSHNGQRALVKRCKFASHIFRSFNFWAH